MEELGSCFRVTLHGTHLQSPSRAADLLCRSGPEPRGHTCSRRRLARSLRAAAWSAAVGSARSPGLCDVRLSMSPTQRRRWAGAGLQPSPGRLHAVPDPPRGRGRHVSALRCACAAGERPPGCPEVASQEGAVQWEREPRPELRCLARLPTPPNSEVSSSPTPLGVLACLLAYLSLSLTFTNFSSCWPGSGSVLRRDARAVLDNFQLVA